MQLHTMQHMFMSFSQCHSTLKIHSSIVCIFLAKGKKCSIIKKSKRNSTKYSLALRNWLRCVYVSNMIHVTCTNKTRLSLVLPMREVTSHIIMACEFFGNITLACITCLACIRLFWIIWIGVQCTAYMHNVNYIPITSGQSKTTTTTKNNGRAKER